MYVYKYKSFVSVRFITVIKKFRVTIATDCQALTLCINVSHVLGYEEVSNLLFQRIASVI
jgi:hypothetical protein